MALIKGFTWKIILPACVKPKNTPCSISKIHVTKQLQVSLQRLSLSDVSNPGSPISPHELSSSLVGSNLHIFTLKELQMVTHNFSKSDYLGEGGFGKVYKGCIDKNLRPGLKAQPVAVKVLDLNGTQGHREWLAEVIFLGQLKHPHLVNLIGYCYEDEHRLLVYEYMALGNLDSKLFKNYSSTLPWLTRLKIALGAAQCLAFLHGEEKPVIYRDFKASNILLDSDYNAKLSDFGLATDGPQGEISHISNSVMGTEGYAAPEYINTGHLTTMCDVYSFGVVLLELLTGRQSVDKSRCKRERDLVGWARPMLKDFNKFDQIIDSRLEGQYSTEGAKKLAALAHQCLSHNPKTRPTMTNVVKSLEPLLDLNDIPMGPFVYTVVPTDHDHGQKSCDQKKDEKMRDKLGDEKKEKKEEKARNWRKKRRRIRVVRSRNVYSDTDLYKALGTYLYSPHN